MTSLAKQASDIALDERSVYLRQLVCRTLDGGSRGHVGSTLSLIEILRVLYDDILHADPSNPNAGNSKVSYAMNVTAAF